MFLVLFFIEFALIFFLSREVSRAISHFLLRFFRSHKITIYSLSFLFLPGVIVHELAHYFMANILFVKTGEIEFMPQIHGNNVKLGSVAVAKADPIRRFFIGIAPIIVGLIVIFGIYLILFPQFILTFSWKEIFFLYMLFEIGNTMYSSSKDMEGALGFFIIVGIIVVLYFLIGFHLPSFIIQTVTSPKVQGVFEKMDIFLGILAGIDIIVSGSIRFMLR